MWSAYGEGARAAKAEGVTEPWVFEMNRLREFSRAKNLKTIRNYGRGVGGLRGLCGMLSDVAPAILPF